MKTDTVNTEKWKIDKTGINLFIDEGDWQVCEIGKDNDTNRGKAELIITAINACKEINPDNPLNVAKALPGVFECFKKALNWIDAQMITMNDDQRSDYDIELLSQCNKALKQVTE